ncbi:ATP-binding cassette domain-containing protein [Mesorhizobium sp. M7A.F.Ca.US.006.01.1.1]|nr:ATP-binding cassette domain-containing protein [Mesorhizobium sp. M7A.F.Ca.US.006.01.1.1]
MGSTGLADPIAPLLRADSVTKQFGGLTAIKDVNFTLRPRELRCLIGPNGAGKSTFFKMLTGQIVPTSGSIKLRDIEISGSHPFDIARMGVGIKTQVPNLFNGLCVRENLVMAAARGKSIRRAEQIASDTLDRLGLTALADKIVGVLAHGQRQWTELAMVLSQEPDLVLLDEPAAGMSHAEIDRTAELILEINKTQAVIVVEHDMSFIRKIADVVTVFNRGSVLIEGNVHDVLRDKTVRDVYLGKETLGGRE